MLVTVMLVTVMLVTVMLETIGFTLNEMIQQQFTYEEICDGSRT
jgi:hypothetical protein